jgi:hypothetical protein
MSKPLTPGGDDHDLAFALLRDLSALACPDTARSPGRFLELRAKLAEALWSVLEVKIERAKADARRPQPGSAGHP